MRSNRLIFVLCFLLAACNKHVHVAALPPPVPAAPAPKPTVVPVPVPAPPNAVIPPPSALVAPDRAFAAGNYDEAARGYEDYLRANLKGAQRDQALFYLGLSQALRPAATVDWARATAALKELVDQHPDSPFRPPASLILSLRSELDQVSADSKQRDLRIKQLTTELDRLKKIDADRRRRP